MRPLRLDLAGFTVFREQCAIDFTDADFFALVGPTGSGKSTVLDAICFALYGTVPRWGNRNAIANALAPSAAEARVRLVFESAGSRYVATRVVRRDGKGRVSTAQAGLQLMPAGFDVSKLDTGLSPDDLGEVLAGTAAEMEAAVAEAVGLPYEQFTTCVVLPQGEFAEFLHAKPATRQQILVNLLGLHVYERVRERAGALGAAADAQLAAVQRLLADAPTVSDDEVTAAASRVEELDALATTVDQTAPRLAEALHAARAARTALDGLEDEVTRLSRVRAPDGLAGLTGAVAQARTTSTGTLAAVSAAEEHEQKLRAELAAAADVTALRRLLDLHAERDRVAGEELALRAALDTAHAEHAMAAEAVTEARAQAERAGAELDSARRAYQDAQAADRAAALRAHLTEGEPCPVCAQTVATLPPGGHTSALADAEAAGKAARVAAEAANAAVAARDSVARDLDRALAGARAQHDQLATRRALLDDQLSGAPPAASLHRELEAVAALRTRLDEAAAQVLAARAEHRRSVAAQQRAEDGLRTAWRAFDSTRDAVAPFGPPEVDRDDLAAAWAALAGWAVSEVDTRERTRRERAAAATEAGTRADTIEAELVALFDVAGLTAPNSVTVSRGGTVPRGGTAPAGGSGPRRGDSGGGPPDYPRAAAVALERARAEHDRLVERQEQTARLATQRAEHERDGQLARSLATHLRANNFERWLLAEALDLLVDGASRILRELSGGQYDLVHDKGEFHVVDHHDAGLRRGVRTLSGGETFQASLALALALSEQLAGLSTGSASLESILLDEGFGTLDVSTLDVVAATLENLAARGDRMVGVVTHVGALAERIPVRYMVRKDARTSSVERVG